MNIFKKYLISIFLIVLLINTAYGYAVMGANTTAIPQETAIEKPLDLKNATDSDQDIIMAQHLIELDAVQFQSENKLIVRETLIFKNIGSKDFYGSLMTWLPDGIENIRLSKSDMMTSGEMIPLEFNKTGNIISWQDYVEQNKIASFLYYIDYVVDVRPDASSITEIYSKKLAYPTLIKYDYNKLTNPDLLALVLRITKPNGSSVKFLDENRNEIMPDVSDEKEGIYRFSSLQFKEINVELSKSSASPAAKQDYTVYVVLGILILLVLLYPYISKKLKREEADKTLKITSSHAEDEPEVKGSNSSDSKGLLQELKELEAEYKSGNLLDEEYEDKKKSIQNKLKSSKKRSK